MLLLIIVVILLIALIFLTTTFNKASISTQKYVVSYDFDNTLKNQYTKETIYPVLNKMKQDICSGHKVIICTLRGQEYTSEIESFLKDNKIKGVKIIATNQKPKSRFLTPFVDLGYKVIHYDDMDSVLKELIKNVPEIRCYRVLYRSAGPNSTYSDIVIPFE